MAIQAFWTCDGCGKTAMSDEGKWPADWSVISVTLEGFSDYPVGPRGNGTKKYELCVSCQRRLKDGATPSVWSNNVPYEGD